MHAGFVNGSGILLTLFSTVLFASHSLTILLIIGGVTAVIAQFTKLLQVNVKQKLACSTIAQMGFMIMQCGLGFFNAAVVHLILHGFYKAYLFLSAGEEVGLAKPQQPVSITIKPGQAAIVLFFGTMGAFLFAYLTGKTLELNSGLFLILIVAITVGQVTYNIVKEQSLTQVQKVFLPAGIFITGITSYALLYNGITAIMSDMPFIDVPLPISGFEISFGMLFLAGFFIMKLGIYRNFPWLYVKLMNSSQPNKKTVFNK
jgi:NAD(P)H-quinone oxidoreductase subunit 5